MTKASEYAKAKELSKLTIEFEELACVTDTGGLYINPDHLLSLNDSIDPDQALRLADWIYENFKESDVLPSTPNDKKTKKELSESVKQFKVGQMWLNRIGEEVIIIQIDEDCGDKFPIRGWVIEERNSEWYTSNGMITTDGEDDEDLVELISGK